MPVVGIYTKDFPIFPGTLSDSTIIVVAEAGNEVTYRSTIGALRSQFAVANNTTSELAITTLNTTYPNAGIGFEVICENITDNPLIYKKGASSWYSIPLGGVSATT
jgi:hypothetical protein